MLHFVVHTEDYFGSGEVIPHLVKIQHVKAEFDIRMSLLHARLIQHLVHVLNGVALDYRVSERNLIFEDQLLPDLCAMHTHT